jgi:hypothetical protein
MSPLPQRILLVPMKLPSPFRYLLIRYKEAPTLNHARQAEPESSNFKTGESDIETTQPATSVGKQKLDARLVGFFILEFGVIFHSVVIGLTFSTTGSDFNTLRRHHLSSNV